jgi:hypothetical protein
MEAALAAHRKQAAKGTVPGSDTWTPNIWKKYGVNKASFYHALQWEAKHPGCLWSGANFYRRGKIPLLTVSMEDQLAQWIAVTQRQSGGWVAAECVLRVAFALMRSDPEHYKIVQAQHPEYQSINRTHFSGDWLAKLRKKLPALFRHHRDEAYLVGGAPLTRAMIETRAMVDAISGYVPSTEQCVRVRGPTDAEGVVHYHELKFDFSATSFAKMERDKPESYAVYLASYKLLAGKSANAANTARVVSNEPSLIAALGKYATTQVRVTSNKKGERNVFCEFCGQTLVRACTCTKAKCKALASGGPPAQKVKKRMRDED